MKHICKYIYERRKDHMLIKSVFANSAIPSHHTEISGFNFVKIIVDIIIKVVVKAVVT